MNIKEISVNTLVDWQQRSEKFKLIDIRSQGEMQNGMIPTGVAHPMTAIAGELDRYQKDETIVIYCRSGVRSAQVCNFMQQQGFTDVINLGGGIMDWAKQGFEIVVPTEDVLQACL